MYEWSKKSRCPSAQLAVQQKIAKYSIERAAEGIVNALDLLDCRGAENPGISHLPSFE